jgi:glycosyltransferase involved in cell wall biosynthesis
MTPATVAVFCNSFLPYSQTFVWDELRSHERYQVEVFAWRRLNEQRFPGSVHVARPWYPLTLRNRSFEKRFERGGFSLVHAHFGWAGVHAAGFARRHRLPLVVTFHGYDVALLARGGLGPVTVWPYTLHAAGMLASLQLGLCASTELLEMLVAAGVPRERLREHQLGIDVEVFKPKPREAGSLRVAMIGRLVEKKGFGDGIRAFATAVKQIGASATLTIAGDGPLGQDLRSLVRQLNVERQVSFLGSVPHARVAEILATADVLLAPSVVAADGDRDSGLLSAKEASACGCIPIATRHGGIPTIVDHGVTGFLVAERDVAGMTEHLAELSADTQRRAAMGQAARDKMCREFELHGSVQRLERHYDDAIRRYASDRPPAESPVRSG